MVYIDLDNVLADFWGWLKSKDPNVLKKGNWYEIIADNYNECFAESKVIEKNLNLLKGDYRILSSLPSPQQFIRYIPQIEITNIYYILTQNKFKFTDKLGIPRENVIILPDKTQKRLYVKSKDDILYDDYYRNIESWEDAGGTGILVPYEGKK